MAKVSLPELINAAFALKVRVGPLGQLPLNYMGLATFGVLGILNPGFWLVGLAAETAYLYALATNRRFQNYIAGKRLRRSDGERTTRIDDLLAQLDPQRLESFNLLKKKCDSLTADLAGEYFGSIADQVNSLLMIFAKMLLLEQRIQMALDGIDVKALERNIAHLAARNEAEPEEAVKRSLEATLEIQRMRQLNIKKSEANLRLSRVEIERIKNQVNLISEEIVMKRDPEQLSTLLNGVVRSIQDTSKFVSENSSALDSIEIISAPVTVKNQ